MFSGKDSGQGENGRLDGLISGEVPETEVLAGPAARRFTKQEKLRILEAYERAPRGEKGAICRQAGIYASTISKWKHQRTKALENWGASNADDEAARELTRQLAEQEREIARLKQQLQRAGLIIEAQKKISALWGVALNPPGNDESDSSRPSPAPSRTD